MSFAKRLSASASLGSVPLSGDHGSGLSPSSSTGSSPAANEGNVQVGEYHQPLPTSLAPYTRVGVDLALGELGWMSSREEGAGLVSSTEGEGAMRHLGFRLQLSPHPEDAMVERASSINAIALAAHRRRQTARRALSELAQTPSGELTARRVAWLPSASRWPSNRLPSMRISSETVHRVHASGDITARGSCVISGEIVACQPRLLASPFVWLSSRRTLDSGPDCADRAWLPHSLGGQCSVFDLPTSTTTRQSRQGSSERPSPQRHQRRSPSTRARPSGYVRRPVTDSQGTAGTRSSC